MRGVLVVGTRGHIWRITRFVVSPQSSVNFALVGGVSSLTMFLASNPLPLIPGAVRRLEDSETVLESVLSLSLVNISSRVHIGSFAIFLVVLPFTIVGAAVGSDVLSVPFLLVVLPFALVHMPITARRLAPPMLHSIHPISLVHSSTIGRFESPSAVLLAVLPLSLVNSAIGALQNSESTLRSLFPRSNKSISILVYEFAIPMLLVVLIFALVNRTILSRVSPCPVLHTIVKVADIVISVVIHV
mmetsp:Transcript_23314/g.52365  ORF Transcript_23314/g.52365 Transcript_23314/m.52365 type:complete len:244 (-) Transcript_23314:731-1462(-)